MDMIWIADDGKDKTDFECLAACVAIRSQSGLAH